MVDPTKAGTGLMILEVAMSNLNGDPDRESDPRTLETSEGEFGMVSDVSIKRKVRDMVLFKDGPIWEGISKSLGITAQGFDVLERPDRNRAEIGALAAEEFLSRFWDARIFGSNLLVEISAGRPRKERKPRNPVPRWTQTSRARLTHMPVPLPSPGGRPWPRFRSSVRPARIFLQSRRGNLVAWHPEATVLWSTVCTPSRLPTRPTTDARLGSRRSTWK